MNKAYDLTKDQQRLVMLPEPDPPDSPEHNPILEVVLDRETAGEIRAALSSLPAPYQEILYFKYYRDLTSKQIADALDIPEGTVKSRLSKAKQLIAGSLGANREGRAEHADR
jgi:RNA polymerase sigma-70 factor (ECF subfamily)